MWKCHVDESTAGRYAMVLDRDLNTAQGLDLKFSENIVIGGEGPYEKLSENMFDVRNYEFNSVTDKIAKP